MPEQKSILTKVQNFFGSVQGILVSVIAIGAVLSSVMLRHDAKIIKSYVDIAQVKADIRFEAMENEISKLTQSVDEYIYISNGNFTTVKSEFKSHLQKSKELKPDERLDDILRIVDGIYTEVKKND